MLIEQWMYPKRGHTHDDVGDVHEILTEEVIHLLVQGMLACVRSRSRIQLLWSKSRGVRLYTVPNRPFGQKTEETKPDKWGYAQTLDL